MATYGAIPSSSPPPFNPTTTTDDPTTTTTAAPSSSSMGFVSRARARGREALASRRSWREVFHLASFSLPRSFQEALLRLRTNPSYFAMNYAIVVLVVVFVSLLYHPISLMVFLACMLAWLFLYFLRDDEPLVILGRAVPESVVLASLSVFTLVVLLLTGATTNILTSLAIGLALVALHALFRGIDDLFLEEEGRGRHAAADVAW